MCCQTATIEGGEVLRAGQQRGIDPGLQRVVGHLEQSRREPHQVVGGHPVVPEAVEAGEQAVPVGGRHAALERPVESPHADLPQQHLVAEQPLDEPAVVRHAVLDGALGDVEPHRLRLSDGCLGGFDHNGHRHHSPSFDGWDLSPQPKLRGEALHLMYLDIMLHLAAEPICQRALEAIGLNKAGIL